MFYLMSMSSKCYYSCVLSTPRRHENSIIHSGRNGLGLVPYLTVNQLGNLWQTPQSPWHQCCFAPLNFLCWHWRSLTQCSHLTSLGVWDVPMLSEVRRLRRARLCQWWRRQLSWVRKHWCWGDCGVRHRSTYLAPGPLALNASAPHICLDFVAFISHIL